MQQLRTLKDEMTLRNFSKRTARAYLYFNERFLDFVRKPADEVRQADVDRYLLYLAGKELKPATRHLTTAALKFYYCGILKRRFRLVYPKLGKHLPELVSKEEVFRMVDETCNLKHKLLIVLLYSSGLRVGEAVRLRVSDVDAENGCIFVHQGKGNKGRVTITSKLFMRLLRQFLAAREKKCEFIFYPERNDRSHISIKTAQKIVEAAAIKAGIKTHCHALRSSFATHLLEEGTDVHYVQRLLGHSSIRSTQGYLNVTKDSLLRVKSPIDS